MELKIEYDINGAYVNYKGTKVHIYLDTLDYGGFRIKEFIYGPINTWIIIEEVN